MFTTKTEEKEQGWHVASEDNKSTVKNTTTPSRLPRITAWTKDSTQYFAPKLACEICGDANALREY